MFTYFRITFTWAVLFLLHALQVEAASTGLRFTSPFVFYTGVQSPVVDILHARLQEACYRIGRICEVRRTGSAERALLLANDEGDGDALRPFNLKELAPEKTDNLLLVPESIYHAEMFVYTWREDLEITGFQSFAGLNNGARVGVKVLEKNIPGDKVLLPSATRLFRMLDEHRLDTVSEHGDIGDFIIRQNNFSGLCKRGSPLITLPGHVYVNRMHAGLVDELSASIAEMKHDGSFDRIKNDVLKKILIQSGPKE